MRSALGLELRRQQDGIKHSGLETSVLRGPEAKLHASDDGCLSGRLILVRLRFICGAKSGITERTKHDPGSTAFREHAERARRFAFEIDIAGFRRCDDREDSQHRVSHHQKPDINIGPVNAVSAGSARPESESIRRRRTARETESGTSFTCSVSESRASRCWVRTVIRRPRVRCRAGSHRALEHVADSAEASPKPLIRSSDP